ncbi:MAG: SPOR domain-containing protein, partial [Bacteroidota bacterium]|nr:SPOR domain-containing protein [Bacteroidota bacterium]
FGKFSYDNNRQIQFEPFFTEFLSAEIYGLDTLTGITPLKEPDSKIIDEKEKTKIKEPEPVPAPVPVPVEEEQTESDENNDKKNHFARILVFSLIPLILVCAWIIWAINMGYVSNAKFDFSKVNFNFSSLFQKKATPVPPKPIVLGPKPVDSSKIANNGEDSMNDQQRALFYHESKTQEKEPEQAVQNQDVQKNQSTVPSQKKEIKKETKKDKTTEKVEEKVSSKIKADTNQTSADKKYYIIAGSFKKLSFAKNLRQELEKNGFHAEILTIDSQTFRVALGSFRSKDSANKELKKLKVLKNSDTYWLYSK